MMMTPKLNPTAAAPTGEVALRAAIMALGRGASIEVTAKRPVEVTAWAALLPPGTEVFIAWVPGTPPGELADVAARLRAAGQHPVPHIAARHLPSRAAAEELLARLRDEAQVSRALLIAGDAARAPGPFGSSLALLETGLLPAYGLRSIAVAGYPEGHPALPEAELLALLRAKAAAAAQQGLSISVVSQFCFEGAAVLAWLRRLRAEGIALPVRVGVAGPATLRTLLNYGIRCGVGNSLRALGTHTQSLAKLLTQQGPEAVVASLADASRERPALAGAPADLGVAGLHVFPFGGFPRSAQWLAAVREGRFQLTDGGFQVNG
jgi:methylenetetrahydrofolate reductase (NADPH)